MGVKYSIWRATNSHSSNRYSCSHMQVSNCPPANFAIHYSILHASKDQPDVVSDIHAGINCNLTERILSLCLDYEIAIGS